MSTQHTEIFVTLPSGTEPDGIRIATTSKERVRAFLFPRMKLEAFDEREYDDRRHKAVYLLFSESRKTVYIGQAKKPHQRIYNHRRTKRFWTTAIVAMSNTTKSFNGELLDWLEWQCVQAATEAGRCTIKGSRHPDDPDTVNGGDEIFADLRTLVSVLGFPVFEPKAADNSDTGSSGDQLGGGSKTALEESPRGFYLQESAESLTFICECDCGARGHAKATGTVVKDRATGKVALRICEGSTASLETTKTVPSGAVRKREELLRNGILKLRDDCLEFTRDYLLFSSPSGAASVVLGQAASGWTEWRTADGRKLKEFKRRHQ